MPLPAHRTSVFLYRKLKAANNRLLDKGQGTTCDCILCNQGNSHLEVSVRGRK